MGRPHAHSSASAMAPARETAKSAAARADGMSVMYGTAFTHPSVPASASRAAIPS